MLVTGTPHREKKVVGQQYKTRYKKNLMDCVHKGWGEQSATQTSRRPTHTKKQSPAAPGTAARPPT